MRGLCLTGLSSIAFAFARESGELRATVAVAGLARLHDALFDQSGAIAYELAGRVDQEGKPSLRLALDGELVLRCQRCLGPVRFRFEAVRSFLLVPADQALSDPADEAEDTEQLYADRNSTLLALVEDEVILRSADGGGPRGGLPVRRRAESASRQAGIAVQRVGGPQAAVKKFQLKESSHGVQQNRSRPRNAVCIAPTTF